jgi:hypothetical protein
MIRLYILIIEHRYGRTVSAHPTDLDANDAAAAYCREEWAREMGDKPMPDDPGELICDYFDGSMGESWAVEDLDVPWLEARP